jgi:drug/metabolite transporter (DMT)-like permease
MVLFISATEQALVLILTRDEKTAVKTEKFVSNRKKMALLALAAAELGALYSLQRYANEPNETRYLVIGALIFGIAVPALLLRTLQSGGIGQVNFLWNVLSTLGALALGILVFGEHINGLQAMGVVLALLGVGMVLLNQS